MSGPGVRQMYGSLVKAVLTDLCRNRRALSDRVSVSSRGPDALTVARNSWAADLAERREAARLEAQAAFDESLPRFYTGGPDAVTADVLREAAKAMRERAEAATPGPWECMTSDSGLSYRCLDAQVITEREGDRIADVDYDGDAEGPHGAEGADAAHIASWHPAVALAVADWLEIVADHIDINVGPNGELRGSWDSRMPHSHKAALAVARAYLGTGADS